MRPSMTDYTKKPERDKLRAEFRRLTHDDALFAAFDVICTAADTLERERDEALRLAGTMSSLRDGSTYSFPRSKLWVQKDGLEEA